MGRRRQLARRSACRADEVSEMRFISRNMEDVVPRVNLEKRKDGGMDSKG